MCLKDLGVGVLQVQVMAIAGPLELVPLTRSLIYSLCHFRGLSRISFIDIISLFIHIYSIIFS